MGTGAKLLTTVLSLSIALLTYSWGHGGEREIKKALRKTLFKYPLHQDQDLFDQGYKYIRMCY